nr:cold shock domain-containing protein [Lentzea fradiae]
MTSGAQEYRGRVDQWNADAGWGTIAAPEFDGPIWVHFSAISPSAASPGGYRSLRTGETVDFTAERANQDEFRWRAIMVTRSEGNPNSEENRS